MSEHQVKEVDPKVADIEVDPGELQFDFGIKNGMVIVDFGKAVKWFGLPPDDADEFAQIMMRVAHQARTGRKVASVPG